jgi:hypothetical protein
MKIFNLILIVLITSVFISAKPYFKDEPNSLETERINFRINDLKSKLILNSKYNSKIAFFIDMRIPSGKNRFFVYDLQNNKILDQGLVAHGCGSETGVKGELKFSNVLNSNCTSLGRYALSLIHI